MASLPPDPPRRQRSRRDAGPVEENDPLRAAAHQAHRHAEGVLRLGAGEHPRLRAPGRSPGQAAGRGNHRRRPLPGDDLERGRGRQSVGIVRRADHALRHSVRAQAMERGPGRIGARRHPARGTHAAVPADHAGDGRRARDLRRLRRHARQPRLGRSPARPGMVRPHPRWLGAVRPRPGRLRAARGQAGHRRRTRPGAARRVGAGVRRADRGRELHGVRAGSAPVSRRAPDT